VVKFAGRERWCTYAMLQCLREASLSEVRQMTLSSPRPMVISVVMSHSLYGLGASLPASSTIRSFSTPGAAPPLPPEPPEGAGPPAGGPPGRLASGDRIMGPAPARFAGGAPRPTPPNARPGAPAPGIGARLGAGTPTPGAPAGRRTGAAPPIGAPLRTDDGPARAPPLGGTLGPLGGTPRRIAKR
jgi:hypothetical protein